MRHAFFLCLIFCGLGGMVRAANSINGTFTNLVSSEGSGDGSYTVILALNVAGIGTGGNPRYTGTAQAGKADVSMRAATVKVNDGSVTTLSMTPQQLVNGHTYTVEVSFDFGYGTRRFSGVTIAPGGVPWSFTAAPDPKKIQLKIVNQDGRDWQLSFVGTLTTVAAGATITKVFTEDQLSADGSSAELSSFVKYAELFHPAPDSAWWTTNGGSLIRPDAPNVETLTNRPISFFAGPFKKSDAADTPPEYVITIPSGTASGWPKTESDVGLAKTGDVTPPPQTTQQGADSAASTSAGSKALNDVATSVTAADGTLKDPVTPGMGKIAAPPGSSLAPIVIDPSPPPGVTDGDKLLAQTLGEMDDRAQTRGNTNTQAIVDVLTEADKRAQVRWEQSEKNAADAQAALKDSVDKLAKGLAGDGYADSGTANAAASGAGNAQQAAGNSAGQSMADMMPHGTMQYATAIDGSDALIPPIDVSLGGGQKLTMAFDPFAFLPNLRVWMARARNVILWGLGLVFLIAIQRKLDIYVPAFFQVEQAKTMPEPAQRLIPGAGWTKQAALAAMLLTAIHTAMAAIIVYENSNWPAGTAGSVTTAGRIGDVLSLLSGEAGHAYYLINQMVPVPAFLEFAAAYVVFSWAMQSTYAFCASIIKTIYF